MVSLQSELKKIFLKKETKVYLSDLLPENHNKEDVIFTFLPLLHLENQRKVNLNQEEHFGPVEISVFNRKL
jgi:chromatin segregation and condensation protein Rec8/ScpA/Scc1 (kleisin family)